MTFPRSRAVLRLPLLLVLLCGLVPALPLAAAQVVPVEGEVVPPRPVTDSDAADDAADDTADDTTEATDGATDATDATDTADVVAAADTIRMEVEILRVDRGRDADGAANERFAAVSEAVPGDLVEYRVHVVHTGDAPIAAGLVVVTVPFGEGVAYVEGSAGPLNGEEVLVDFSADGGTTFDAPPLVVGDDVAQPEAYDAIRWTFLTPFEPNEEHVLFYRVEVL